LGQKSFGPSENYWRPISADQDALHNELFEKSLTSFFPKYSYTQAEQIHLLESTGNTGRRQLAGHRRVHPFAQRLLDQAQTF
jgi:hypothetical protein